MSELQHLAASARPEPGSPEAQIGTFRIDSDAPAERAIDSLVRYFGADRTRAEVRLVIDGREVGYLTRTDLYECAPVANRGLGATLPGRAFGSSASAGLPGSPPGGGGILVLRCPVPLCPEAPVFAVSFDEDHPPHCRTHPDASLVLDGA